MSAQPTIAVVEDDEDIRSNVCSYLARSGLQSWGAESAEDFYVRLLRARADLVVVDIGLPGEDGLSLLTRLAAQGVPTVLMTARADLDSRIEGLEAGALQYFVKPVDMQELVAGIRSQLRNKRLQGGGDALAAVPWQLDTVGGALRAPNQQVVSLTTRELELLSCLLENPGVVVSKQALAQAVGGRNLDDDFHRIESALTRLRRKTLDDTGLALPVRAVFGKGLVFAP
ncbi:MULTISPECIES: response regulator transcription factor [unclassified Acidovorax]|uniref:response regulator transcription factor n=1 Tax=unclassified Acidovorax TaxID=2684926 RepID=UPI001C463BE1|nr:MULTISPECIES: response regulator transcription factor [unclassified Acidovorax]MBV7427431.1 response regulator transcription factor [Acidovorax sp. sif0732]MBV7449791.1 response regulator transcription factor [Acidovorax sp. sif0715]